MNSSRPHQLGFTLIELMIGLVIGLVGLMAVSQIMLSFNKQRNSINQTMATQNNGVMALYLLERDISQAGYGMMGLNCDRINYAYNGTGYYNSPYSTSTLPGNGNVALTTLPVRIIDGGTASDTIEVQYGRSTSGMPGTTLTAAQGSYSDSYAVAASTGFAVGDMFVANANSICTLAKVGAATTATLISHLASEWPDYNVSASPGGTGWNAVSAGDLTATPKASLANLGAFISRRFTISGSTLAMSELPTLNPTTTTPSSLVDDIIFVKAQYGYANSTTSTAVASWTAGDNPATTAYSSTQGQRIIAIRIGVVARSPLMERDAIDASTTLSVLPPVSGTSSIAAPAAGTCAKDSATQEVKCTAPDTTVAGTHYRYRTFSTVIPLKNVIWTR
jgi:type IV pilus assembly protein PilW